MRPFRREGVPKYAMVYSEMKPHPTRCTAGDLGFSAASAPPLYYGGA
jgi:hypothetical protein